MWGSFELTIFDEAFLVYSRFSHAKFNGSTFRNSGLMSARMRKTKCMGTIFDNAVIGFADFRKSNLTRASFNEVAMVADFRKADLRGADLSKATHLDRAQLVGSLFNRETLWPEGFDPEAAGATRKEYGEIP